MKQKLPPNFDPKVMKITGFLYFYDQHLLAQIETTLEFKLNPK